VRDSAGRSASRSARGILHERGQSVEELRVAEAIQEDLDIATSGYRPDRRKPIVTSRPTQEMCRK
jgi:hypothetical protein